MILENKLHIYDPIKLAKVEEKICKKKALELFDEKRLLNKEENSFNTLLRIHKYLFEDIYDFAGQIRDMNIAKGHFHFVPVIYLSSALDSIERMPQSTFDEIVEKYIEMNIAHPFCEGNGRSMRIWLNHILKSEINKVIDWSQIGKSDFLAAMERSPIKDTEIKLLLKEALTDKVNDRDIYMKGIDTSYHYEGYDSYHIKDL